METLSLKVSSIGCRALKKLKKYKNKKMGEIISVFANTIYIKTFDEELIVVTKKPVRAPININVVGGSDFDKKVRIFADVEVSMRARARSICIDKIKVNLQNYKYAPKTKDLKGVYSRFKKIRKYLLITARMLDILSEPYSIINPSNMIHKKIEEIVREIIKTLKSDRERILKKIVSVLGMGFGFTPSGDDFVSGFLSCFNILCKAFNGAPLLVKWNTLCTSTTWISAKLLDYAQKGIIDDVLEKVILSIIDGDGESLLWYIQDLIARGHTSGLDISMGVLFASSTFYDLTFNESVTADVSHILEFKN